MDANNPLMALAKRLVPASLVRYRLTQKEHDRVLFTFDDGPDPQTTPQVLDCLDRFGVRALFFIVGNRISRAPQLLNSIIERGHELGNHSFSHELTPALPFKQYTADILQCQRIIEDTTGFSPRYFRPPYGAITLAGIRATRKAGLQTMCWSVEGGEFGINTGKPWREIASGLADRIQGGDIVLLHDNYRDIVPLLEVVLSTVPGHFDGSTGDTLSESKGSP